MRRLWARVLELSDVRGVEARVHAVTKPQTTGLVLMITGTIIRVTTADDFGVHEKGDIGMMVLLVLFALMTSPVTAAS